MDQQTFTIAKLKISNPIPPSSPRKLSSTLHCTVTSKSNLKKTKNTQDDVQMFTMHLSDEDPTSFIRAVCFDKSLYDMFIPLKTYDLCGFKIKKSNTSWHSHELTIDANTKITESRFQIPLKNIYFNISQILRHDADNVGCVNIKTAKVLAIDDLVTVGKYPNLKEKRDVLIADETGQISFILWRQQAKDITFKQDDVISVDNAITSNFQNKQNVTVTSETIIKVLQDQITVAPTKVDTPKKQQIASFITTILAIKDFRALLQCINCRCDIELDNQPLSLITCHTCKTSFLAESARLRNECSLLLSSNQQWFKAKTGVLQHMFQWSNPKIQIQKYTVRVDLLRTLIEHAVFLDIQQTDDDEPPPKKSKESHTPDASKEHPDEEEPGKMKVD